MTEDELFEDVKHWKGRADAAETERNEARAALAMRNSDVQALVLLLHQAKAYLVIDQLAPAVHSFEIEKRMKYRDHIVEQISAALAGVVSTSGSRDNG